MKDINSLSDSVWRCKYHIVFTPKYRRQEIYRELKAYTGKILREWREKRCSRLPSNASCRFKLIDLIEVLLAFVLPRP